VTNRFTNRLAVRSIRPVQRTICAFIVLIFAWQTAAPVASAGTSGCTMQCCRRTHGKKTCCRHSSNQTDGPSLAESRRCSGDCAVVAPASSPLVVRSTSVVFAIRAKGSPRLVAESFTRVATPASSNSFQRPPPVL
jgi:hypothetical protein